MSKYFHYICCCFCGPKSETKSKLESKKLITNVRQYFDERVCDDLSEVLLQYLPFEDKMQITSNYTGMPF